MPASVAIPAVRQKRSKLAPTCCQASSTIAAGKPPAGVVDFSMALLSFADSVPRAYWLKAGNAYLTFSTSTGTSPRRRRDQCCILTRKPGHYFAEHKPGLHVMRVNSARGSPRRRSPRYMLYWRVLSRTRAVSFSCRNPKYHAGIGYSRKAARAGAAKASAAAMAIPTAQRRIAIISLPIESASKGIGVDLPIPQNPPWPPRDGGQAWRVGFPLRNGIQGRLPRLRPEAGCASPKRFA
jgi:hypothetical protein